MDSFGFTAVPMTQLFAADSKWLRTMSYERWNNVLPLLPQRFLASPTTVLGTYQLLFTYRLLLLRFAPTWRSSPSEKLRAVLRDRLRPHQILVDFKAVRS